MNPIVVNMLLNKLQQIVSIPNIINTVFDANEAYKIREEIYTVAKSTGNDDPQISIQLLRAKDRLFYTNQYGQAFINPFALGEIIFGLDYLVSSHQTIENKAESEDAMWSYIHPLIQKASKKLYMDGHYANAAEDAFIEINDRVKHLYNIKRPAEMNLDGKIPDGDAAITTVFSLRNPLVEFCDLKTDTGRNKQKGYMQMLEGAVSALRNPKAHSNTEKLSAEEAFRRLCTASMLMYAIDEAVLYSGIKENC